MGLSWGQADHSSGASHAYLILTNTGATSCTVGTHLVLSFLDDNGQAIGQSVASPEADGPGVIRLDPAESRDTNFSYGPAGALDCQALESPSTAQLVVNQTEALTLPPMLWPLCPARVADQVILADITADLEG